MKGDRIYLKAMSINSQLYGDLPLTSEEKRNLYDKYLNLIKKAAYLGHREAMYEYGLQFENIGYLGVENPMFNPSRMNYWYHKAIKLNHATAYNNLASNYESGSGVEKNYNIALEYYKRSGELGDPSGKKNYKLMIKNKAKLSIK